MRTPVRPLFTVTTGLLVHQGEGIPGPEQGQQACRGLVLPGHYAPKGTGSGWEEAHFCPSGPFGAVFVPMTGAAANTQGLAAAEEHCHSVRASPSSCFAFPASSLGQARSWEGTGWAANPN